MARKLALLIGINKYDDRTLAQLNMPVADVRDLGELLTTPEIGDFNEVQVLTDQQFADIQLAIADFFADKKPDDLLLLYFSGHGVLNEDGHLYLAVRNTRHNRLSGSAISARFIVDEMDRSGSRRQILILDCCHSAAFVRGVKSSTGAKAVTKATFEGSGYAKVVITATDATQYALEGDQVVGHAENSLFTHFLLEGIRTGLADSNNDGRITLDEWYDYAYRQVIDSTSNQTPRKWVYNQEGEQLTIALNPYREVTSPLPTNSSPVSLRLEWVGRSDALSQIKQIPHGSIYCDSELSVGKSDSESMLLTGDALHILKSLLPSYAGRIKCIYIDPPYNTGNEGFSSGGVDMDGDIRERTRPEPRSSSLSDIWLRMLFPRLVLTRELMSEDGVVFVNIDDTEFHHLRMLMDEIFGSVNFICTLIWRKGRIASSVNNRKGISVDHEYVLCYSRGPEFRFKGIPRDTTKYTNPDNDPRGPWVSSNLTAVSNASERPNLHYQIINPQTGIGYSPGPSRGWLYSADKMARLISEGRILWPKTVKGQPRIKRFLSELRIDTSNFSSLLNTDNILVNKSSAVQLVGTNTSSKPERLTKLLLQQIPEQDFIVLDIFAGTGTVGEAVLELNREDGGKRQFILIEANPDVARQLTYERLKNRLTDSHDISASHDGFRFCTLDDLQSSGT